MLFMWATTSARARVSRGVEVTSTWSCSGSGLGAIDGAAMVAAPPAGAPLANPMSLSTSDSLAPQANVAHFSALSAAYFAFWADSAGFHLSAATFLLLIPSFSAFPDEINKIAVKLGETRTGLGMGDLCVGGGTVSTA